MEFQPKLLLEKIKYHRVINCVLAFILPVVLVLILYKIYGFAPFGTKSFGTNETLSLLMYMKAILRGDKSLLYSLSANEGGTILQNLTMYDLSVENLFLPSVVADKFPAFYNIMVMLKIGVASLAMSCYLNFRFLRGIKDCAFKHMSNILFSCFYGLSSIYIVGNGNLNVILTGMIFLPMICLGVYRIVRGGRLSVLLAMVVLSLVTNWYTGIVNCLFTVPVFIIEILLSLSENIEFVQNNDWKTQIIRTVRYILSMAFGVAAATLIWLPSLYLMNHNPAFPPETRNMLSGYGFITNPAKIVFKYGISEYNTIDNVSVFAGTIVLIGIMIMFLSRTISVAKKIIYTSFLVITAVLLTWAPCLRLFSCYGTVDVSNLWYGYIGVFAAIFVAAQTFMWHRLSFTPWMLAAFGAVFAIVQFVLYKTMGRHFDYYLYKVFTAIIVAVLISLYVQFKDKSVLLRRIFFISCVIITSLEMVGNSVLFIAQYAVKSNNTFASDYKEIRSIVTSVETADKGQYRIAIIRNGKYRILYSNEDYPYFSEEKDMTGGIEKFLPMAVKYIVTDTYFADFGDDEPSGAYGNYTIYYNPYYIPMAFVFDGQYFTDSFDSMSIEDRKDMVQKLSKYPADAYAFVDGHGKLRVDSGKAGEVAFVSVPCDPGWKFTLNGNPVNPKLYYSKYYMFDLAEGENQISLNYDVKYILPAFMTSFVGVACCIVLFMIDKSRNDLTSYEYIRSDEKGVSDDK